MREILTIIGLILLAVTLRSARVNALRKLGALTLLVASFLGVYFLTQNWFCGCLGVVIWFFLPCIELFTQIRGKRLPLNNRLRLRNLPNPSFFPNATEAANAMEEAGFDHVSDCGWEWAGMQQYFRLFWHPEERAIAAICLCEQSNVAFAFVTVTSHDVDGKTWRTTNFPFSPTLQCCKMIKWNHVPCEQNCFHGILKDHRKFLARMKVTPDRLKMPDPDELEASISQEMNHQVNHNLEMGYIRLTGDGYFQYTFRGLLFLWRQSVKDLIRLC